VNRQEVGIFAFWQGPWGIRSVAKFICGLFVCPGVSSPVQCIKQEPGRGWGGGEGGGRNMVLLLFSAASRLQAFWKVCAFSLRHHLFVSALSPATSKLTWTSEQKMPDAIDQERNTTMLITVFDSANQPTSCCYFSLAPNSTLPKRLWFVFLDAVQYAARKALNCFLAAVVRPWLHSRAELANVDFNSSHVEQYHVSYFPFPIWRDESMHDLIVRVAKCAADAVAQCGRSIRMGGHVMVRVDIALTRQGTLVRPFVLYLCALLHAIQLKPACNTGMCLDSRVKPALTCWVNGGHHSL